MSLFVFKNKTALVTGASSGIGGSFARLLAQAGANLIVVARREDRLNQLKQELESTHGITVDVIAMDLSLPESPKTLFDATEGAGKPVDILLNNAGYGVDGTFNESDIHHQLNSMDLMMRTLTELSFYFGQTMKQRGEGYMLQVGSLASYMPIPNMATYAGSKAFVQRFGRALNAEYKKDNVHVTVLNPGGTTTEFFEVSGQTFPAWMVKLFFMSPEKTAEIGLKALAKNKASVVAGWPNKLTVATLRLLPEPLQPYFAKLLFN